MPIWEFLFIVVWLIFRIDIIQSLGFFNSSSHRLSTSMPLTIDIIDNLHVQDDYNYLLHDEASGKTAVVDAADAEPILAKLAEKGWQLDYIMMTHHHWDHVGGIPKLMRETGAKVVGHAKDAVRIPHIAIGVDEASGFALGETQFEVMDIPGHTIGHIAYYTAKEKALFAGDTLFSIGCGRMFEGAPQQFHDSLQKLAALPDDVRLFAGHEYTLANLEFAIAQEEAGSAHHAALTDYQSAMQERRAEGLPTLPVLLEVEKRLNPFLCAKNANEFAKLRAAKDDF